MKIFLYVPWGFSVTIQIATTVIWQANSGFLQNRWLAEGYEG